jgi:phosphonate transport system ATP-binding protein
LSTPTRNATGISFRNARVVYPNGTVGMKGMTLDIKPGEFVVIVGSSGAGKSTLLRAVNGLNLLSGGSLEVGGVPVPQKEGRALKRLRARTGMIFQDFRLVKRLTVMSNVLVGRLAHVPAWRAMLNLWPKADIEIAYRALERVGIAEKAWVKASQLSGGQQQRVGIARALAQEPSIILADEPVASLDPVTSRHVMDDLVKINRELGITTLVNLHFLDLAREYGQRIIGLRFGELVYDGSAARVSDEDFQQIYGREFTEDDLKQRESAT